MEIQGIYDHSSISDLGQNSLSLARNFQKKFIYQQRHAASLHFYCKDWDAYSSSKNGGRS